MEKIRFFAGALQLHGSLEGNSGKVLS